MRDGRMKAASLLHTLTVANSSQRPLFHISLACSWAIDLMQSPKCLPHGRTDSDTFVLRGSLDLMSATTPKIWLMPPWPCELGTRANILFLLPFESEPKPEVWFDWLTGDADTKTTGFTLKLRTWCLCSVSRLTWFCQCNQIQKSGPAQGFFPPAGVFPAMAITTGSRGICWVSLLIVQSHLRYLWMWFSAVYWLIDW